MKKAAVAGLLCLIIAASMLVFSISPVSCIDSQDSWKTNAPMHQARGGLGVVVVNGKVYAIGGSIQDGPSAPDLPGGFVGTNEEYDPTTDRWTTKASMPTPRAYFAIGVYQNKIYCIGGTIGIGTDDLYNLFPVYINSGVNEVYDPATDTWENKTPMPLEKRELQANVVGDKIYLIGEDSAGVYNEMYDPLTDTWTAKTPMPSGALTYASTVLDNKIYVAASNIYSGSRRLLIYNAETGNWGQGAPVPSDFITGPAIATTGLMAPKRIYVLGIDQSYDPNSDNWTTIAAMPNGRYDFGVAAINDQLYAIGGYGPRGFYYRTTTSINEEYTPFGYGTIPPDVSIVSPENNMTYSTGNLSLTFTVNKPAQNMRYSLDGLSNATINGNVTLSGLSSGSHNVTVYATDALGNTGVSETIYFSIKEPFPTAYSMGIVAVIVLVLLGATVYVLKRKR